MRLLPAISLLALAISNAFLPCALRADDEVKLEYFENRVRPLIAKRCYECHRRKAEGGLRVDSRESLLKGGDSGPAIKPGDAKNSLLWQAVSGNHAEIEMPPKNPLNEKEVNALAKWIDDGAHWPQAVTAARATPDEHGISPAERAFWSFQPIARPTPPPISGKWGAHPIDAFVARDHQRLGLSPNGQLPPRQLIRRLSYDLTGLPPSPPEVDKFENAFKLDSDAALNKLVERLLGSRAYAERWAQHWLDLVRYADTAGDAADFPIPEAYKYRNYVIDAFQNDMPYDRFVREQIAGDLDEGNEPEEKWRAVVATGYVAISRRIGVSPQNLKYITIEDTLNNIGKTFLGLSIGCARCHDHKFDPIPTSDYYALYGIFDSTTYPHAGAEHKPYRDDITYRIGDRRADATLDAFRKKMAPLLKQERALFERYREFQRKPINIPGYNRDVAWKNVLGLREQIRQVAVTFPNLETAFAVREGDSSDTYVQQQGDPKSRGPLVRRGFLQVLGGETLSAEVKASGRLQLAKWITSKDNPLTARVIANRIWHHHLGRGLVTSTSDFGARGEQPSHPELLDFLASYLIDHDWSIKSLHRLILSSQTYQLSSVENPGSESVQIENAANSKLDPENKFLWRGFRQRLDAEQLRDSILIFSSQLDDTPGERHPVPHRLTYFYRQHEPYIANFESNKRTIYLFRQRIRKNRYLDMFDAPDGNLHVGTRRPTTTTLQSLYFMNSPFIEEQANAIARRALKSNRNPNEIVRWLYQHLYSRGPNSRELSTVTDRMDQLLDQVQIADKTSSKENGKIKSLCSIVKAMLASNEFMFIE
jgi:hypothetical protein